MTRRGNTGSYEVTTVGGEQVQAFIPKPLPPDPPVALANSRQRLLERATLALGRLDNITLFSYCLTRISRPSKESKIHPDEIDWVLADHYGFTDEELDFIINYDIKYRMGRDAEADDE